jgi:ABC-2 type transport system permease protein
MNSLADMIWVEMRKALRSRMPLFTTLGSLFMPLGIGFLVFVSRNPEVSRKLGLVSAKANLMAATATNWPTYLGLLAQLTAIGSFLLSCLIISWVFGREFADGTLKDLLAVPVPRWSILLAKFATAALWSAALTVIIFALSLALGAIIRLPEGSATALLQGSAVVAATACLVVAVALPTAFFASVGRGYLLPIGLAMLTLIAANLVIVVGWGEYFPWAVPGLFAQGKGALPAASYWIAGLTALAGVLGTWLWWQRADQSR